MTKDEVYRKLDDKIKDLKSTRVFKKITPKGDLSWYVKWISSVLIIIAMALTSANIYPTNIWFHMIGVTGWLVVGMLWHDRALIVLNSISLAIYTLGIFNFYYG